MSDHVELDLPLLPKHASTVRAVAASLAADAGFTIDEIDDLRLGVNEAVSVLTDVDLDTPGGARMQLHFEVERGAIKVTADRNCSDTAVTGDDLDVLATRILGAVVDDFDVDEAGRITVVKRTNNHADE